MCTYTRDKGLSLYQILSLTVNTEIMSLVASSYCAPWRSELKTNMKNRLVRYQPQWKRLSVHVPPAFPKLYSPFAQKSFFCYGLKDTTVQSWECSQTDTHRVTHTDGTDSLTLNADGNLGPCYVIWRHDVMWRHMTSFCDVTWRCDIMLWCHMTSWHHTIARVLYHAVQIRKTSLELNENHIF